MTYLNNKTKVDVQPYDKRRACAIEPKNQFALKCTRRHGQETCTNDVFFNPINTYET